jgi:hypothetical protein
MRVITSAELANKTGFELSALYERVREELGRAEPDSYEYEVLATSLENIRRAFAAKIPRGPKL